MQAHRVKETKHTKIEGEAQNRANKFVKGALAQGLTNMDLK